MKENSGCWSNPNPIIILSGHRYGHSDFSIMFRVSQICVEWMIHSRFSLAKKYEDEWEEKANRNVILDLLTSASWMAPRLWPSSWARVTTEEGSSKFCDVTNPEFVFFLQMVPTQAIPTTDRNFLNIINNIDIQSTIGRRCCGKNITTLLTAMWWVSCIFPCRTGTFMNLQGSIGLTF